MDININTEMMNSHQNYNINSLGQSRGNLILQKIFKYAAIFFGMLAIILISADLCEKVLKTYKDTDSLDELTWESVRNLQDIDLKDKPDSEKDNDEQIKNTPNNNLSNHSSNSEELEIDIVNDKGEIVEELVITGIKDNVTTTEIQKYIKEQEKNKEKIDNFLKKVDKETFRGTWKAENNGKFSFLSNRTEGEMAFRIEKLVSFTSTQEKIFIVFRLLDGHYIDKWILGRSINSPYSNVSITNTSFSQGLNTFIDFGEIFERVEYMGDAQSCKSEITLDWSEENEKSESKLDSNIDSNYNSLTPEIVLLTSFSGTFKSNCGIGNFSFKISLNYNQEDHNKVLFYSIVVTLLAFSQIFNTIWITHKVSNSQTLANSISLITVLQNIVWNAYGCLSHFFLTVNYDSYTLHFGIPAFLYFANFSIFELKLLYGLWRIKNLRYMNDQSLLRKKLVQFYLMFYLVMFFSLFYVMKFYFEKPYIFFAVIFTWIPQIIFNMIYKNRMSLPIMNILLTSLNKVFLPFYFRGCPQNFFQLKTDFYFVMGCTICLLIEIMFLYSQTLFGPRWFLPPSFSQPGFNFYKSKSEVLLMRPDAEYHDCVICLFSLFHNENFRHFSDDFISAAENSDEPFNYPHKNKISNFIRKLGYYMTDFHEVDYNLKKKPYMMTPCKHYFHTACLESWFKQKKECPSCRQEIEDTLL